MGMISKHNWGPSSYWSLCPFVPHHLFVFVIPSLVHCPTSMAYQLATWPSFITCTISYPIYHYLSIDDLDAYPLLASESKTSAEADINFDLLPTRRRWIFGIIYGKKLSILQELRGQSQIFWGPTSVYWTWDILPWTCQSWITNDWSFIGSENA